MPTTPYGEFLVTMQEFTLHLAPKGTPHVFTRRSPPPVQALGNRPFPRTGCTDRMYIFWELTT